MNHPSSMLIVALMGRSILAVGDPADIPAWLQVTRELGSFGLIAFIVWWYATKVAPKIQSDFLAALKEQRTDYIAAADKARNDYMGDRESDRGVIKQLTVSMDNLAIAVREGNVSTRANTASQNTANEK